MDRVRELNERLEGDLSRVNAPGGALAVSGGEGKADKGLAGLDIGKPVSIT